MNLFPVLAAASLLSAAYQEPIVLPGVLDFPVLRGATPSPDCGGLREVVGPEMTCLSAPLERVNDLIFGYVAEAERRGWKDSGGAANAKWMVRQTAEGCERLTIAGFWDFRRYPEPEEGIEGFVGMQVERIRSCP